MNFSTNTPLDRPSQLFSICFLTALCACSSAKEGPGLGQGNERSDASAPIMLDSHKTEAQITKLVDTEVGTGFGQSIVGCTDIDGDGEADCAVASTRLTPAGASKVELVSLLNGRVFDSFLVGPGNPCHIIQVPAAISTDGEPGLIATALGLLPGASRDSLRSAVTYIDLDKRGIRWQQMLPGRMAGWGMGMCIVPATRFSPEGRAWLAIGATFTPESERDFGAIGSMDLESGVLKERDGASSDSAVGRTVALVSDADGDGEADLAIGCPDWFDPQQDEQDEPDLNPIGRVLIASSRDLSLIHEIRGSVPNGNLGNAIVALPDWNGDGFDEIAIGSNLADHGMAFQGAVLILSGRDRAELGRIDGDCMNCMFGSALLRVGDLDGDSKPDLVVGAPGCGTDPIFAGSVSVVGSASRTVVLRLRGTTEGLMVGESTFGMAWVTVGGEMSLLLSDFASSDLSKTRKGGVLVVPESLLKKDIHDKIGERQLLEHEIIEVQRP